MVVDVGRFGFAPVHNKIPSFASTIVVVFLESESSKLLDKNDTVVGDVKHAFIPVMVSIPYFFSALGESSAS